MENLLYKLYGFHLFDQFLFLLTQNVIVFFLAMGFGYVLLKKFRQPIRKISWHDWCIAIITVLINTLITIIGFQLWAKGIIKIDFSISFPLLFDLILLFMGMDLLMYIFHLLIHRTFLNGAVHSLHHKSTHPAPIDLFVLHPLETLAFGLLWLSLLMVSAFNIYAIIFYLVLNVVFGVIGHLGFEPLSNRNSFLFKYLGTSSFHHQHHLNEQYNFGFYTSIWDRIFGTFR